MKLLILDEPHRVAETAAHVVARQLLSRPSTVLALPTGDTPRGMYACLSHMAQKGLVDFSSAQVFNLDEYLGLPENDPRTFRSYMSRHLWDKLPTSPAAWHIPGPQPLNEHDECAAYDRAIDAAGGVDLAVLGIGENGHIAFNEPGTPWELTTHVVDLRAASRQSAASLLGEGQEVPRRAITMGVKSIMLARRLLLLAIGQRKAKILAQALRGPVTFDLPASALQLHPELIVVVDAAAGAELALADHFPSER